MQTPGGGATGALPVAEQATEASGRGQQLTQPRRRQGRCRVPQQEHALFVDYT